jgi:hypothetical protein
MRHPLAVAALAVVLFAAAPLRADDTTTPVDPALAELLAREKEARKACKIDLCSLLHSKKAEGADVGCTVVKTWPTKDLNDILGKVYASWPWGNAQCTTEVKVKRAVLVAARTEPKYDAEFDEHTVSCVVDRGTEEPYTIKVALAPKISFESGKAVKAEARWGTLEAPSLVYGALYPATGADNRLNLLGSSIVEAFNDFAGSKCLEVKDAWKPD